MGNVFSCTTKPVSYPELGDEIFSADPKAIKLYGEAKNWDRKNDFAKATKCYLEAAKLGLGRAQQEYGSSILYDDRVEGRKWIQKAADKGIKVAQQYLNMLDVLPEDAPIPTSVGDYNNVTFASFPKRDDVEMAP